MLLALLIICYTAAILMIYGSGIVCFLQKIGRKPLQISFPLTVILGLIGVTTLAAFASLVIRINWEFQAVLLAGAIFIYFVVLRTPPFSLRGSFNGFNLAQKMGLFFLAVCLILTFYQAVQIPTNPDTGIYHAQSIHWIETHPAVPGLGNLHNRLAYNSSWLLANAVFSFSFLNIQSFHLLSGLLFLVSQVYFYQGIHQLLAQKFRLSNFLGLAFFLSSFIFLFDQVSSPGTDAPVTLMIWLIIFSTLRLVENKTSLTDELEVVVLLAISIFCFTLKMSAAPILLLPLMWWGCLMAGRKYQKAGFSVIAAILIVLPFLLRNIIQTGYLVYPGFPVDLFHLDWAIPLANVKEESIIIHWFAMLPNVPVEAFMNMSLRDQTLSWFVNQIPRHKAILLSIPLAFCFNLLLLVFNAWRKFVRENLKTLVVYLVSLIGCLFWFLSAPALRFGYGFLLAALFLSIFPVAVFIFSRANKIRSLGKWVVLIGCIGIIAMNAHATVKFDQLTTTWLIPADYPQWSSEPCEFKNFNLLCQASYNSCWYSPFPCALHGDGDVEMRGMDYREGFRTVH